MPLSEEVSRTLQIVFFLRKKWSKACREKSAEAIVVQQSITLHEGQNLKLNDSNRNIPHEGKNAENIIPS